jgi:hypothetical protein
MLAGYENTAVPDQWGIPVRVVSQPSGSWLSAPLVNLVVGFLLGFCVEPVREFWKRMRANVHVYRELGGYLARFVVLREKTNTTGVGGAQFDIMSWQEITRPRLRFFDYFSAQEPAVFLRVNNSLGIQELVGWLRLVGMTYRNTDQMPFQHPDQNVFQGFCHDVLSGFSRFCSNDSSRRRLIKAFNRCRERKAIGFPVRPKDNSAT